MMTYLTKRLSEHLVTLLHECEIPTLLASHKHHKSVSSQAFFFHLILLHLFLIGV